MALVKLGVRKNLKFILLLTLSIILRKITVNLLEDLFTFKGTLITTWLMFGGELIMGLIHVFFGIKKYINRKEITFMGIPLIQGITQKRNSDRIIAIILFFSALLDFSSCLLLNYVMYLEFKFPIYYFDSRLKTMQIIFSSIICFFLLSRKIHLHQAFSLLLIMLSLSGIILVEIFCRTFQSYYETINLFLFISLSYILMSIRDCLEKYLMDYDFCSPFEILFYEGLIGNIFMIIISFFNLENKFPVYSDQNKWPLILLFLFYLILSGFLNLYRLTVINILSPMNRTTSDSFVDPFILIDSYINQDISKISKRIIYKIINIFASLIIIISSIIYNEIVVLNFFGLGRNTYVEISGRADTNKNKFIEKVKTFESSSSDGEEKTSSEDFSLE